jgi:GT2 family glycosyltransferase
VPAVQRSFIPTSPELSKTTITEWLSGCNMVCRREVLDGMDFDWRLLRYSYSEDVDLSYRIYKKFGRGSLWFLSNAKLLHNQSPAGRLLGFNLEAHRRVVNMYMLYKHFGDTKLNILVFLWWNLGEIVEYALHGIRMRRLSGTLANIMIILNAIKTSLKNLPRIRHGDILSLQYNLFGIKNGRRY